MSPRPVIAAILGAGLATVGAVACAVLAHLVDAGPVQLALLALAGGGVMGVASAAAAAAMRSVEAAPSVIDEMPTEIGASAPRLDVGGGARELERIASSRAGEVRPSANVPRELAFALEQLSDRLAEDRRRAQAREVQHRDATARLDETVRQLYAEVERRQAEARSALEVRDAFLARMSHELRTPLNAILGYVEMLEEEAEDPAMAGDLRRVRSSAMNLLGIVTTILDLTQLQTNAFDLVPEAIDLHALAGHVRRSVEASAEANGNTLRFEVPDGLQVKLDRRMLQSILYNLTSNACKYTQGGTVTVHVRDRRDRVQIVVSDTGIGMTERQIEEAFRPFGQADESATRRYDGAGIGLAVVRGFVEAMGGQVAIDSEIGQGARVVVDLPLQCEARSGSVDEDDPTMLVR